MFSTPSTTHVAVYGSEIKLLGRGVGLWSVGYQATIVAAGAAQVFLTPSTGKQTWGEMLHGCKGVVVCGHDQGGKAGDMESLAVWCRQHKYPILAIDRGLLALNAALGGANY